MTRIASNAVTVPSSVAIAAPASAPQEPSPSAVPDPSISAYYDAKRTSAIDTKRDLDTGALESTPEAQARTAKAAAAIEGSATYQALDARQRTELKHVFAESTFVARADLADLFTRPTSKLLIPDTEGRTLLDNLHSIAVGPLSPELSGTPGAYGRKAILSDTITSCACPITTDQGGFGTCTVASMQHLLTSTRPAEYARLMAGLVGPEGAAQMAGGEMLKLNRSFLTPARDNQKETQRSTDSTLFQSAAIAFGRDEPDYAGKDGLTRAQESTTLDELMGMAYQRTDTSSPEQRAAAYDRLFDLTAQGQQAVLLDLDTSPHVDGSGGHAVSFDSVANDRVYFTDPNGAVGKDMKERPFTANGELDSDFGGFRVENAEYGLRSMSLADFKQRLTSMYAPT